MSINLVNGFSDVLGSVNLATNGRFIINQRSNFQTLTQVVVGDYVADAWKVDATTIDYIACVQNVNGYIVFDGYGKKGQIIRIKSKDGQLFGYSSLNSTTVNEKMPLTASINAFNGVGVPISVLASPRYYDGASEINVYQYRPTLNSGEQAMSVNVTRSYMNGGQTIYGGYFEVQLMADGKFNFTIEDFKEIAGGYRNPPTFAPVNYVDDLARCERYYQKGNSGGHGSWHQVPIVRNTNDYFSVSNYFRTTMAGIPTISVGNLEISLKQSASIGSTSQQNDHGNWTTSAQSPKNTGFRLDANRNSLSGSFDVAQIHYDWAAEV
jgi:hypothetical protein